MDGRAPRGDGHHYFLTDALVDAPSKVYLLVMDADSAVHLALALHEEHGGLGGHTPSRLLQLDVDKLSRLDGHQAEDFCRQFADTGSWMFLPDIDRMRNGGGGRFLDSLVAAVVAADVAPVVASVLPDRLPSLTQDLPRLCGLADVIRLEGERVSVVRYASVVSPAHDRAATGWVIIVRCVLGSPMAPPDPGWDESADSVLALTERIQLVLGPADVPDGVIIAFAPHAFTVSQEPAAFAAAERVARRVLGRHLGQGESVTSARGIYYA